MRSPAGFSRWFIFVALFAWAIGLHAQEPEKEKTPEQRCPKTADSTPVVFPGMRDATKDVRWLGCVTAGNQAEVLDALTKFMQQQRDQNLFKPFGGFKDDTDPLKMALQQMASGGQPPSISVSRGAPAPLALIVGGVPVEPADQARCGEEGKKRVSSIKSCRDVLMEFKDHYSEAQLVYSGPAALAFARAVTGISKEWDTYLNETRAQTPLELLVNSAFFKHREKNTQAFLSPPEVQWILLHPSVVVENVKDAIDGEKTKTALMIELAGANWWPQTKWYLPSGASLISTYSDRASASDVGYGVAVYFRSIYSLGYTRHNGKDGVFVSFDLLKLVEDKKKVLDGYWKP